MQLNNSLTFQNLINAYAGETQAQTRYQMLAHGAHEKGLFALEKKLDTLAKNEYTHARMFYSAIQSADSATFANLNVCSGYPFKDKWDFVKNFEFAVQNESSECNFIYPGYAQTAKDEDLNDIAVLFERISDVEKCHMAQLTEIHRQLTDDTMYSRSTPTKWKCGECGHEETIDAAWDVCPLCRSPRGYVMLSLPE